MSGQEERYLPTPKEIERMKRIIRDANEKACRDLDASTTIGAKRRHGPQHRGKGHANK